MKLLQCPFCLKCNIPAQPGKTTCPECSAEFEVDDRGECIFADTLKMRLPLNGFVCMVCGLVQGGQGEKCLYCGAKINLSLQ
jgi:hypothetical protein